MKDNNMAVIGLIGLLSIRLSQFNCNNKWSFGRRGPGKRLHCLLRNPAEPQHQSCSTTRFIHYLTGVLDQRQKTMTQVYFKHNHNLHHPTAQARNHRFQHLRKHLLLPPLHLVGLLRSRWHLESHCRYSRFDSDWYERSERA